MPQFLHAHRRDTEQLDLINTLGMSSDILLSLLDNVLDIAKIEAEKMVIERAPFDFHQVIHSVHQFAAAQAVSRGLRISVCLDAAVPRQLIGDPHRLRQVLINLLANAIKFTQRGGVHLRIALVSSNSQRTTVRCEVIDTGVGMSQEAKARIFEPFEQADQSTTREYGGSGLGTAIAKQLVELMNGHMGVSSESGQGSTFWFEVPFPTQRRAEVEPPLDGVRVLLAGIPGPLRQQIIGMLEARRAETAATSVDHAVQTVTAAERNNRPWQVILVDDNTPGFDAALPSGSRKPRLIALAPLNTADDRVSQVNSPYSVMLNLPIRAEQLLRAVHFASQQMDGALQQADSNAFIRGSSKGTGRPRVLVAEDNPTNRKIIAQILDFGGYDVSLSATGTQAVEALEQADFDVVILDKHMPGMSGMEVAAHYLQMRGEAAAPMIMLTAEATAEAMEECKAAGMKAFLTKPIDPEMLFKTIHALIGTPAGQDDRSTPAPSDSGQPDAVFDESVLTELDRNAYSPQFIVDIVESFESDMLDLIGRLESAIHTAAWSEIPDIRHTIEGTARSSGATGIVALLGTLKGLDTVTPQARQARIEALRACLAVTLEAMRLFLAQRSAATPVSAASGALYARAR